MKSSLTFRTFISGSLMVIFFALTAGAQSPVPDKDELDQLIKELHGELDDRSRDLAEEYLDILEQLQEIVEDYSDYLSDLDPEARQKLIASTWQEKRTAMKNVCLNCHTENYINNFYKQYDDFVIN